MNRNPEHDRLGLPGTSASTAMWSTGSSGGTHCRSSYMGSLPCTAVVEIRGTNHCCCCRRIFCSHGHCQQPPSTYQTVSGVGQCWREEVMSAMPNPLVDVHHIDDPQRQVLSVLHAVSHDPVDMGVPHYHSASRVRETSTDQEDTIHSQHQSLSGIHGMPSDLDIVDPHHESETGHGIYQVQDCRNNLVIYSEVRWDSEEDNVVPCVGPEARPFPPPDDAPYLGVKLDFLPHPTCSHDGRVTEGVASRAADEQHLALQGMENSSRSERDEEDPSRRERDEEDPSRRERDEEDPSRREKDEEHPSRRERDHEDSGYLEGATGSPSPELPCVAPSKGDTVISNGRVKQEAPPEGMHTTLRHVTDPSNAIHRPYPTPSELYREELLHYQNLLQLHQAAARITRLIFHKYAPL
ncbi:uncharacterized protein [Panulirus ornatus]|uniref:uncharacterized protein n=1 Tax=Panulirus ornatus TaxID=150431 RepID=UPI003A8A4CDE